MLFKETERFLKRILKKKYKYTKMLLITFLMTGGLGMALPITPNANGEYIVNSGTGDGEVNATGNIKNIFKVDDGKKLTFTGEDIEMDSSTSTVPYTPRPVLTISGSGSSFEGTGTKQLETLKFLSGDSVIIYSVTDASGNFINGLNQKVTLNNISNAHIGTATTSALIKVEAKNGYNIKGAELNLIGNLNRDGETFAFFSENENWLVEVEGDTANDKYSELTINATKIDLEGMMNKKGRSILNVNLKDGADWTLSNRNSIKTSIISSLNMEKGSNLDVGSIPTEADGKTSNFTLRLTSDGINSDGLFTNAGTIMVYDDDHFHDDVYNTFTIDGNYHGNNGKIMTSMVWNAPGGENGENSKSDLVYITGNASGTTSVVPFYIDDTPQENEFENYISGTVQQLSTKLNSVPVVKVAGNSTPTAFTGTARTAGAAEAQLTSRQVNGIWEYYWTITPIGSSGATAGLISGSDHPIYIMAQPVSAYVLMPKVNMEMGYSSTGTLHERKGEKLENISANKGQIWTRVYGNGANEKGKERFEYESNLYGVQLGHNFKINKDRNGNNHLLGGYISYNKANVDFFDRYRAENGKISDDKYTGKGKSESISLGLTKTKYTENGSYYDLVGQISYLQNKYKSRDEYDVKQKGYGLVFSGEVGKSFEIGKDSAWIIEPQAQLMYQYLNTESFSDGMRKVNQGNRNGLRGRTGIKISYNGNSDEERTDTYYAVANVWHDFTKYENKYTNIGSDKVTEKLGTTWGEIGLGAQASLGQKSNLYIDTRYEQSFGNSKHSGYRGTVGFKHTF